MKPVQPHRCIQWHEPNDGEAHGALQTLARSAGQRIDIVVGPEQAALILDEQAVSAVLLEGNHLACVLHPGEEPGDLGDNDYAERLGIDRADIAATRRRLRVLQSGNEVLHLTLAPLVAFDFGTDGALAFDDAEHGPLEIEIEGAFRLKVADPVRFYESFLRNTEDLPLMEFEKICGNLVRGGIAHVLDVEYERIDGIERDHDLLAGLLSDRLAPSLLRVGLALDQLEVTRLQTPVGLVQAEVPQESRSLATAERRQ